MKEFVRYVTHDELGNCLGMYAAVYRERVVDGRRVPNPAYGTLEMLDGLFILMNKKTYAKLEKIEGVFLI